MRYLIRALVKYGASDLHLKTDRPPLFRINGKLIPAKMPELTQDQLVALLRGILTDKQLADLDSKRQIDFSFKVENHGRFRCNAYFQRGGLSAAIRMIPFDIPKFEELNLPSVLMELCQRQRGLLLLTGATGTGKSTTMASIVQYLNQNFPVHILTLEDPIEFVFRDLKASITQREVGSDLLSFHDGLYAGLRQDPDIIVLGELRDREMIQVALTAAETGHLVITTLHTNDARSTLDRIIDVFPADARNQVRIQLATTLVGIVSQQLVMRADGAGRIPAVEVMVKSPAMETYILKGEIERIPDAIASSNTYYKMQTMNQSLERLVRKKRITADEALKCSPNPDDLKLRLSGVDREEGYEMAIAFQKK